MKDPLNYYTKTLAERKILENYYVEREVQKHSNPSKWMISFHLGLNNLSTSSYRYRE